MAKSDGYREEDLALDGDYVSDNVVTANMNGVHLDQDCTHTGGQLILGKNTLDMGNLYVKYRYKFIGNATGHNIRLYLRYYNGATASDSNISFTQEVGSIVGSNNVSDVYTEIGKATIDPTKGQYVGLYGVCSKQGALPIIENTRTGGSVQNSGPWAIPPKVLGLKLDNNHIHESASNISNSTNSLTLSIKVDGKVIGNYQSDPTNGYSGGLHYKIKRHDSSENFNDMDWMRFDLTHKDTHIDYFKNTNKDCVVTIGGLSPATCYDVMVTATNIFGGRNRYKLSNVYTLSSKPTVSSLVLSDTDIDSKLESIAATVTSNKKISAIKYQVTGKSTNDEPDWTDISSHTYHVDAPSTSASLNISVLSKSLRKDGETVYNHRYWVRVKVQSTSDDDSLWSDWSDVKSRSTKNIAYCSSSQTPSDLNVGANQIIFDRTNPSDEKNILELYINGNTLWKSIILSKITKDYVAEIIDLTESNWDKAYREFIDPSANSNAGTIPHETITLKYKLITVATGSKNEYSNEYNAYINLTGFIPTLFYRPKNKSPKRGRVFFRPKGKSVRSAVVWVGKNGKWRRGKK